MRAYGTVGLALILALAACGDAPIGKVRSDIVVTATHVDDEGRKLLDFGKVAVLDRATLSVLVQNRGRADLRLEKISVEEQPEAFAVKGDFDGITLAANAAVEIPITFVPPALGVYEGRLVLAHDDDSKPPVEIRLVGDGSTVARVEVEPGSIDFGLVGDRMQEVRTLTIRSVGTGPLIIDSIEFVDTSPEFDFLSSTRPARLPPPEDGQPGGFVDLRIACSPLPGTVGDSLTGMVRILTTDPDRREVLVPLKAGVNHAPVAVIHVEPGVHAIETNIRIDGSDSHDPDGHVPLGYQWRIFDQPISANAVIADPSAAVTNLVVDVPGEYEIGLDVTDSTGLACFPPGGDSRLPCARQKVTVKSDIDLQIDLVWNHKVTDLDLHVIENGMPMYSSGDCYWANKRPDFGVFGDPTDDPAMVRESLKGFGPESIVFAKPSGGTYRVVVEFAKTNGAIPAKTEATLRVFVYGVLAAEYSRTLEEAGQIWDVLDIAWPSAVLTPIDDVRQVLR